MHFTDQDIYNAKRSKLAFFPKLCTLSEHINGEVRKFWSSGCFGQKLLVENRKREHCHSLHIQISLDSKFQLKLAIVICWIKFAPKGIPGLKHKK